MNRFHPPLNPPLPKVACCSQLAQLNTCPALMESPARIALLSRREGPQTGDLQRLFFGFEQGFFSVAYLHVAECQHRAAGSRVPLCTKETLPPRKTFWCAWAFRLSATRLSGALVVVGNTWRNRTYLVSTPSLSSLCAQGKIRDLSSDSHDIFWSRWEKISHPICSCTHRWYRQCRRCRLSMCGRDGGGEARGSKRHYRHLRNFDALQLSECQRRAYRGRWSRCKLPYHRIFARVVPSVDAGRHGGAGCHQCRHLSEFRALRLWSP